MGNSSGSQTVHRQSYRELAEKLLSERQEMLVTFCKLAGLEPFSEDKPVAGQLQDFCQILMDYMAFGHFEIFRKALEGKEDAGPVLDMAKKIYSGITRTTTAAVSFNDKYEAANAVQVFDELPRDLSDVGEQIAYRIELEDRLLGALLSD